MLKRYLKEIPRIPEAAKRLQKEKELYLYGNSEYALKTISRLKEYHIEIKGVLVSKEYFHGDMFQSYPVYVAEGMLKKCDKPISIVLGFEALRHQGLVSDLCDNEMICHVFVFRDSNRYLACNHFEFPSDKLILLDDYYERLLKRDLCREYYEENYDLFYQTYEWLEDEKSRKTMEKYLEGHVELMEYPFMEIWDQKDVDTQYFPEDVIHLTDNEVFVDCGAYTGDTLKTFTQKIRHFSKYYALEPDKKCFDKLHAEMMENVVHIPVGAWDKKEKLSFSMDSGCGRVEVDSQMKDLELVTVDRLDDLIDEDDNVSFIKMDIEGAELRALQGTSKIIKRNRPKLAICVYHKREDLITIPQFIKSIVPEYKFYLRAHCPYPGEVVLYGICN